MAKYHAGHAYLLIFLNIFHDCDCSNFSTNYNFCESVIHETNYQLFIKNTMLNARASKLQNIVTFYPTRAALRKSPSPFLTIENRLTNFYHLRGQKFDLPHSARLKQPTTHNP